MNADTWARLQSLFHRAEELPPDEREDFLDGECAGEPELAKEVRSLLAAPGDSALLAAPVDDLAEEWAAGGWAPGDRVGPYRILSELASGGMGTVYLAERADGAFEQQVALKIVRGVVASPSAIARFLAERRILARLEHPNVARLLDGGTTEQGAPYFAMERVEGEPIDRYCDRRRLSVRQRLELLLTVCDAVQHAHRNLVVHRDLKPSNLLVTPDGTPKLLDFGIAKLLDPGGEADGLTRRGEFPMTPEYASPEQVRGEPASVSSDVYALGLLLYELLTGRRAQQVGRRQRSEIERAVCEQPATRPSTAVARVRDGDSVESPASPEEVASRRRTTPRGLRRRLRGDLDTIVLTALRKEPERRYPSVEALAADVRRHLRGLPVEARGDAPGYRAWKFLGRHRLGVGAAALLLTALAASTLIAGYGLREARREARTAAEISSFLERVFRLSDPSESRGRTVTVREVLDSAVERLEEGTSYEPAIDVRLRRTLGSVYKNLGLLESGEPILRRAAERGEELLGPFHEETLAALNELGFLVWNRGRYAEAEEILRDTVERSRAALGADAPRTLTAANGLGLAVWRQGRFEEAEEIFSDVLERRRRLFGDDDPEALAVLNNLAGVFYMRGELGRAESLYGQVLETGRKVRGSDHPATLDALNNLAMVYAAQEKLRPAQELFEELVAVRSRVLGPEHPRTLGSLAKLGDVLAKLGSLDEAEELHRTVLAARERILGPTHADTLWSKAFLGQIQFARGDLDAAEKLRSEVLASRRRVLGEDHPDTLQSLRDLGELRRAQGRFKEAEVLYREALEGYRGKAGEDGYWTLVTLDEIGLLALLRGHVEEALSILADAAARAARTFPEDLRLQGTLRLHEGRALAAAGRAETAKQRFREAAELLRGEEREEALRRLAEATRSRERTTR